MSMPAKKPLTIYCMKLEHFCTPITATLNRETVWRRNEETDELELDRGDATLHVIASALVPDPAIMMGSETIYHFDDNSWQIRALQKNGGVWEIWFGEKFPATPTGGN